MLLVAATLEGHSIGTECDTPPYHITYTDIWSSCCCVHHRYQSQSDSHNQSFSSFDLTEK